MTSQEKLWPWQSLPGYQQKASEYAAAQPPHQEPLHPQPAVSEDKPNHAIGPAIAVAEQPVTSNNNALKNQYIPTAIRTPCIFAFCLVVLVVFILLEYAAATHIQGSGSGQKASQHAKRIAYPQVPTISTTASSTTSSATPSPSHISTAPPPGSWSSTDGNYFLGAYVPTLVAIWLSIWWKCIFARLKEMEPFYQLKKSGGAKAEDSLLLSYADSRLPTVLLNAWRARHWRTFAGAVNLVLITLCTLFASETLSLQAVGDKCDVIVDAIGSQNDGCQTELKMRPVLGFILGAICFIIAVVALWVKMKLSLRQSGIFAEATSIAGIACLANAGLCQETTQSIQLPERRFTLAYKNTGITNSIVEITPDVSRSHPPILEEISECPQPTPNDTPLELKTVPLLAFLLFQIGIVFLILYYRFVSEPGTNNALENFMDSDSFGVHLFMSLVGLSVKIYWSCIESRLRRLLPYVALASPNGAPAEKSVLLKTASHPLMALFSQNTWKLPLLGLVSLMASLSEVLVITLNAVPFTTATAYTAFEVSVYLSTCILVLMIATILLILHWKIRTKHADLPEIPRSMFDVLGLVGDGQDWKALGLLYEKERNQEIAMWKCNFSAKKFNQKWQIVAMRL